MYKIFNRKKEKKEENKEEIPITEDKQRRLLYDFFIPRNIIDVVFILVCFILAWYALTYDIAAAKVPIICANYWNKWASEKAGLLGGNYMNITPVDVEKYISNKTLSNFTMP